MTIEECYIKMGANVLQLICRKEEEDGESI